MYRKIFLILAAGLLLLALALQHRGIIQIPKLVTVGPLNIPLYGLILLTAIVAAIVVAKKLAGNKFKDLDIAELLLWLLIPGIIGARLYHVVTDFQLYANNLWQIFNFGNGGLGFIGALGGGALGLYLYARQKNLNILEMIRPAIVVVPLAQAIGRLGNLINQEIYGPPTDLPWGIFISEQNRLPGYEASVYFHPLYLYEVVANIVLFTALYYFYRRGFKTSRLITYYLAGYGVIRFCLDFFRLEGNTGVYGLSYTQWLILALYLAAVLFGIGYQLWYKRKYGKWFTKHS